MLVLRKNKDWNTLPSMDSFVNDFFGNSFLNTFNNTDGKVNILENDNDYSIEMALPGYEKDNVNIEIDNNMITISSNNEERNEEKNDNYIRREFKMSSFQRSFEIPDDVDEDKIDASMENGVLYLKMNKIKEVENKTNIKKIDIK
jgi:HSP20 family protein